MMCSEAGLFWSEKRRKFPAEKEEGDISAEIR